MNMTILIVSERSFELVALCLLLVLALVSAEPRAPASTGSGPDDELPADVEMVRDEHRELNENQLESIVKHFGGVLKETMDEEMERLVSDLDSRPNKSNQKNLQHLKEANAAASKDIKTRIELLGDNEGNMPQMHLGAMARSFVATASSRLSVTGEYVANKMRAMGSKVQVKIPHKLRRLFQWPSFLEFKIRFHKNYHSIREELYRQMIFLRSLITNEMQNLRFLLGRDRHLNGANQYSDWTAKEFSEKTGNHMAERSADYLAPGASRELSPQLKSRLESLAKSGKNIFDQPIPTTSRDKKQTRSKRKKREAPAEASEEEKRQRRVRRDTGDELDDDDDDDDELIDEDELNETEDELDETEEDDLGLELTEHQLEGDDLEWLQYVDMEDLEEPEDYYETLTQFAVDLDPSQLTEIEDSLDEVLGVGEDFKPVDLRKTGCLVPAENQQNCGICYAITTTIAASYYDCMERKLDKPERFHPHFLSDCGRMLIDLRGHQLGALDGCLGGHLSLAHQFVREIGTQLFKHYEPARVSERVVDTDTCAYPKPKGNLTAETWWPLVKKVPFFERSEFVDLKREELDLHLRTVGPVIVNLRAWKGYKEYKAGILSNLEEALYAELHSVLIVGHDVDANGRDYWIILNSHGTAWGEHGYMRIYASEMYAFMSYAGALAPLPPSE